jgi:signal transduction histidine kinase
MLARIQSGFETQRTFTADASHELRSPLTVMRGELEVALRRDRDPDEYRRVLASTLEEVVRLGRVTEDLLILARSDSGGLRVRSEPIDVAGIVESAVERLRRQATAKDVVVEATSTGNVVAELDPVLLGQVVWNLVQNAIEFAPRGGRVRVETEGSAATVTLRVEDDGPGFPPEQANRLFDRFFRADAARPHTGGTGLGLSIVKAVADAHGGSVHAENRAEGGARVTVAFPRAGPWPASRGTGSV